MAEGSPSRASGVWLIVLTLLSWASVPLFLRDFADWGIDPFASNGWRYLISAVFWLPLLLVVSARGKMPAGLLKAAIVPVCFNIAGQTAFAWGPTLLEPGFFSFVFRVQIVFVMIGAWLLFPAERALLRSPIFWTGAVLVVLGSVGLMLFRDQQLAMAGVSEKVGIKGDTFWLGVGVSLLAGVLFAGYGLSVRYYVSKYTPVVSFGIICQFTAIGMVVLMLLFARNHGADVQALGPVQWGKLLASAFIGIAISHVMYYASLRRLGVSTSVGIIQLQPIVTALGSLAVFGERLNAPQWMSGIVGVLGAMIMLAAGAIIQKRAKADELAASKAVAESEGAA